MVIHLLVGALVEGDGIGNSVLAQYQMLGDLGYNCDIFVLYADDKLKSITRPITSLKADKDDLIIDHVGGYSFYARCVYKQPCRKVLCYHNITPPELVEGSMKNLCRKGLDQISKISGMYDFICGDSAFNLECLRELGEQRRGDVLPIPVKFPYKMIEKKYIPGKTLEFIFVGRMVQNKRIEDIVDVFVSYHNNFNKNSRLTLVGNTEVDRNYTELINQRIQNSNCSDSISLTGKVSDNELQQIFKRADMYLCMSEHEGFCIPLIEAMYNGLIVFAYDSATISDTLGGSGILLKTKEPDEVSEIINTTLQDENHVNDIIGKEIVRAQSFSIDNVEKELADLIAKWSSAEYKKRNDLLTSRPGLNLRLVIMMFMPGLMPFLRKVKHAIVNK